MPDTNYEETTEIIFGRWKSQILCAGVRLGIFDCAASHVKSTADIADELDLDDKLAYRLLRALSSMGFLKEHPDHRGFSITPQGELLRPERDFLYYLLMGRITYVRYPTFDLARYFSFAEGWTCYRV